MCMKRAGFIVIILGFALTVFTAMTFASNDKFSDTAPVQISNKKPHTINWSPYLGLVVTGAGFLIFFVPQKK